MTYATGALLIVVAILAAAIVVLLVQARRRARVERALRASEERFRYLADRFPVIIWAARPDATLDYLNNTAAEFTGIPLEKLLDNGWLETIHPDDLERCLATFLPAFEARAPFVMEYRMRRFDGIYRWVMDTAVLRHEPDGSYSGQLGCTLDITEYKNAEVEIRRYAGRLIEAQDAERARIGRDLHDDASQQIAGLSIAFSSLRNRMSQLPGGESLQADLRALHERTAALAQSIRDLSHDLHPTVLRHAGLVAALTDYCREVEGAHGPVLRFTTDGDCAAIAPDAALCLYRIAQEALRNVVAHAGARRADVRLVRAGNHAELTITDDGDGFDVDGVLRRGKGLGVTSITERARLAGGTVSITAEPKGGTCVCVRIPAAAILKEQRRA